MASRIYGFSFVELVIALAVAGFLLAAVLVPLRTQIGDRQLQDTRRLLDQAREALLVFASTYGYLPCPADAASGGQEPALNVDHTTGACPSYHGFLPAALLGITPLDPQGYVVDAWGSAPGRIRYAVSSDTVAGIATPFTRQGGMTAAGLAPVGGANNLLHVCGSGSGVTPGVNCGAGQTLASNAVFVVWSAGSNGGAGGGSSVHEAENPSPNGGTADRIFVSRAHSTAAAAEFDDLLTWVSSVTLVTRLMAAGQLP